MRRVVLADLGVAKVVRGGSDTVWCLLLRIIFCTGPELGAVL